MDATKSGAIFLLKNIAIVRSPHAIPATKGCDNSNSSAKASPQIASSIDIRSADEAAEIRRRFSEIYRSTPKPSAILNSSQNTNIWEHEYNSAPSGASMAPQYGPSSSIVRSHYHRANHPYYHSAPQLHNQLYGNYGLHDECLSARRHPQMSYPPQSGQDISSNYSANFLQPGQPSYVQKQIQVGISGTEEVPDSTATTDFVMNNHSNSEVEGTIAGNIRVSEIGSQASKDKEVSGPLDNAGSQQHDNDITVDCIPDVEHFSHYDDRSEISTSTSLHSGSSSAAEIPRDGSSRSRGKRKLWVDTLVTLTNKPIAASSSSGPHLSPKIGKAQTDSAAAKSTAVSGSKDRLSKGKIVSTGTAKNKRFPVMGAKGSDDNTSQQGLSIYEQSALQSMGLSYMSNLQQSMMPSPGRAKASKSPSQSKHTNRPGNLKRFGSLTMIPTAMLSSPLTTYSAHESSSSSEDDRVVKKSKAVTLKDKVANETSEKGLSVCDVPSSASEHLQMEVAPQSVTVDEPLPVETSSRKNGRPIALSAHISPTTRSRKSLEGVAAKATVENTLPESGLNLLSNRRVGSVGGNKKDPKPPVPAPLGTEEHADHAVNTAPQVETRSTRRKAPSIASSSGADWSSQEVLALHSAQLSIEPTAADFWQQVGVEMSQRGHLRSADECRDEWFQASDNINKKKNLERTGKKGITKVTEKSVASTSSSSSIQGPGSGSGSTASSGPEGTELKGKRKRVLRADLQRLAEESSKATRADDIFEFQKEQNARVFVTVGGNKGQGPSSSTSVALSEGVAGSGDPLPGFRPKRNEPKALDGLSELQSPEGKAVGDAGDKSDLVVPMGKKNNTATYVHNLSKRISATRSDAATKGSKVAAKSANGGTSKLSKPSQPIRSGQKKASEGGMTAAFCPKTGKVIVAERASAHASPQDVEEGAGDSDDYNQNLSEEEDGDF